jgi:dTDP-4-amino-4,6-dideoxygalactose transaminase
MSQERHLPHVTPSIPHRLNIVRPTFPALETFIEPFRAALQSGQVTNGGPWVGEFEHQLSEYLGVPTLAFSSGQAALMTMLRAAGIEGGEVIVPSFTFAATPHAVRWCGAKPVFADISPATMSMDPEDVEAKLTPDTTAILAVDAYGVPCEYEALTAIARRAGIKILFDSAAAFGSRLNGQLVGGFGDAQIFSFHATKAMSTMEGGCLCSNDPALIERAKVIRNFGQVAGGDCSEPGLNGKLAEIGALIGIEQLKVFDAHAENRRRCASRMQAGLAEIEGIEVLPAPAGYEPIWLYLPVVVDADRFGLDRDQTALALEPHNLMVRKYYSPPCHMMSAYKSARQGSLPHSERISANVLALPVFNDMTEEECDGVIAAFRAVRSSAEASWPTPDKRVA